MFAVIEANGRQLRVQEGDIIRLDRLAGEPDQEVVFDRVLFAHDGQEFLIGSPVVAKARVTGRVLRHSQARKVTAFRYKPKKRVRTRHGHRQPITELRIEKIALP